jgi:hypothetical protein
MPLKPNDHRTQKCERFLTLPMMKDLIKNRLEVKGEGMDTLSIRETILIYLRKDDLVISDVFGDISKDDTRIILKFKSINIPIKMIKTISSKQLTKDALFQLEYGGRDIPKSILYVKNGKILNENP